MARKFPLLFNFINSQLRRFLLHLRLRFGFGPRAALADPIDVAALNFAPAVCLNGPSPLPAAAIRSKRHGMLALPAPLFFVFYLT